jgi:secreted trypsin-like serine protease
MGRRFARLWGIAVAVMLPVLVVPGGAGAIVGGDEDGEGHPNVGFVVAIDEGGNLAEACTGTLIAESVVLTAAHCLAEGFQYFVSFKPAVDLTLSAADNGFLHAAGFESDEEHDVGVLYLAEPATVTPARLTGEGALDQSRKGDSFTYVGYGVDSSGPPGQPPSYDLIHFTRRTLTAPLTKLSDTLLSTRAREGSICKGDSGGPVFKDGVVVALGNYANARCQGTNSGPRLDIEPVQSFLESSSAS